MATAGGRPSRTYRLPEGWVTFGRRVHDLARIRPDRTAIVFAPVAGEERRVSWRELDESSTRMARLLAELGVEPGSTVVVALPNCVEHYFASYGAWKLGATVMPLRWDLPEWERDRLLDVARPSAVVGEWNCATAPVVSSSSIRQLDRYSVEPVADQVAYPVRAIASGGSTGRPKIILTPAPAAGRPDAGLAAYGELTGWRPDHVKLIAGPLYHMSPFAHGYVSIFGGGMLVTMERFQAARALDLIERHRVQTGLLVPTMLYRMARVPDVDERDLSSVVSVISGGAKLPGWVFRKWIELIGPTRIWEAYGATEAHGNTLIRGDDWLQRPGSVGRPFQTLLRICGDDGEELPAGEIGEIYMRPEATIEPTFEYLGGHQARTTSDGLVSVGDLGWVDHDGYLFVADRRVDMIISGGANIYPAEIESALSEHPDVADVAVIGLADEEWGRRVHALVQPRDPAAPPTVDELDVHCRERLAPYKAPRTYELVPSLPRNDVGKIQRLALVAERESPSPG